VILILSGLWEVGRITQVEQVMWNSTREAARDGSLGQDDFPTVASSLLTYLQAADKVAFPPGHTTSFIAPVVTLPANTIGYTCWDQTANREMFTVTFTDVTSPSVKDPTDMAQLDVFAIGLQVPYRSIAASPLSQVTGATRLTATVYWAAMVDSPFQISPYLPAQ
jgi:hypothetical protein